MSMESGLDYMRLAAICARQSPDQSTQNGAVIVGDWGAVMACNAPPAGVHRSVAVRHERPEKYAYTEHAERNVIFGAARARHFSTHKATMYCLWAACDDCARAIIASGIERLVTLGSLRGRTRTDWNLSRADEMLAEAGVDLEIVDWTVGETILFGGEETQI
jgi:dCMP deaminase